MIISDEHKFVFIHVPKCAGTSVRNALSFFDSRSCRFSSGVNRHNMLGEIDYNHIPLFIVKDFFPEAFLAIQNYWSFAIMRDPFSRFPSSIFQRLAMYSDASPRRLDSETVKKTIAESVNYLSKQQSDSHFLPPEYIHFQRQSDFTSVDGARLLSKIYRIDDFPLIFKDVIKMTGPLKYRSKKKPYSANTAAGYRNQIVGKVIDRSLPISSPLIRRLPDFMKQYIIDTMFVPHTQKFQQCFNEEHVKEFIKSYYARDIEAWNDLNC